VARLSRGRGLVEGGCRWRLRHKKGPSHYAGVRSQNLRQELNVPRSEIIRIVAVVQYRALLQ